MQFLPAFVVGIDGIEEGCRVGRMNKNGQAKFSAGSPDWVPARVVDADQTAVWISIAKPELFEQLEPAGALLFGLSQLHRDASSEVGALAIPPSPVGCSSGALPIEIDENHEPVSMLLPEKVAMLLKAITQLAVEAGADRDSVAVHQTHELLKLLPRMFGAEEEVRMDIDGRELSFLQQVLFHSKFRCRAKVLQQQLASVLTIERFDLGGAKCRVCILSRGGECEAGDAEANCKQKKAASVSRSSDSSSGFVHDFFGH